MNPGQTTRLVTWLCKYGSSLALRPAEHLPDVSGFKGQGPRAQHGSLERKVWERPKGEERKGCGEELPAETGRLPIVPPFLPFLFSFIVVSLSAFNSFLTKML